MKIVIHCRIELIKMLYMLVLKKWGKRSKIEKMLKNEKAAAVDSVL